MIKYLNVWKIIYYFSNKRIVGGSSGGEACIISGGGSIMGIGSDIGGSIRMVPYRLCLYLYKSFACLLLLFQKPAYFNGVYGHKV